ncbi:helitron_like_N domain-containing protein [Trichonephila clavata]|uniref:Helitron_like_N domain-containing protein n=1 Tax=Trichonephila clavata TaxID=2740835 RepID=A0A8X6LQC3_TRICU|nr:helitron_like_N domain-containing protein [Trichonephila clavata]
MHVYAQDSLTYVRKYGHPDLFITLTCKPFWEEIKDLLLPGQQSFHRHDLRVRVFKQKIDTFYGSLYKELTICGEIRCWKYSNEWQKRGLFSAHICISLIEKLIPTQIDGIIRAELPYKENIWDYFKLSRKTCCMDHMGYITHNSPCMKD